jgi:hypothetical protein
MFLKLASRRYLNAQHKRSARRTAARLRRTLRRGLNAAINLAEGIVLDRPFNMNRAAALASERIQG